MQIQGNRNTVWTEVFNIVLAHLGHSKGLLVKYVEIFFMLWGERMVWNTKFEKRKVNTNPILMAVNRINDKEE